MAPVTTVSPGRQRQPERAAARAEDFRRRLLDGLATSITEVGYRNATVADIVRHAHTSRRTFYQHFADKEACFVALLTAANAEMIRYITAAVDPVAPIQAQVRQAVEELFDVHVERVNVSQVRAKPKRRGLSKGIKPGWKKAIVQIREGESIQIFEGAQV